MLHRILHGVKYSGVSDVSRKSGRKAANIGLSAKFRYKAAVLLCFPDFGLIRRSEIPVAQPADLQTNMSQVTMQVYALCVHKWS